MAERTSIRRIVRFPNGSSVNDSIAVEEPLTIRLHGEDLAVLMRTPGDDRALVAGFLLAEGIIQTAADIRALGPCQDASDNPNVVAVELAEGCPWDPESVRRTSLSSTSCGICGKTTIENLLKRCLPHPTSLAIDVEMLRQAPRLVHTKQDLFETTGGIHAAAIVATKDYVLTGFAEDVGRHNAIDKVIGRALLEDTIPLQDHVLWVSGRSSFDVIQKALAGGLPAVICVGAPTSMAVDLARKSNLTLVGFTIDDTKYNVYAGAVTSSHG